MTTRFLENFFLCTLDDIRARHNINLYDHIRCAGMIRQLIMDGDKSLVDLANRRHKLKIIYEVADSSQEFNKKPAKIWANIIPTKNRNILYLNRNTFLKSTICIWDDHSYNVGDIIDYFSHFIGGIHSGIPKDEKEKTFTTINSSIPVVKDWPSHSLYSIIAITLKALEPLAKTIKENPFTGEL